MGIQQKEILFFAAIIVMVIIAFWPRKSEKSEELIEEGRKIFGIKFDPDLQLTKQQETINLVMRNLAIQKHNAKEAKEYARQNSDEFSTQEYAKLTVNVVDSMRVFEHAEDVALALGFEVMLYKDYLDEKEV